MTSTDSKPQVKGVCFFDIDGTLTNAATGIDATGRSTSAPVQACLDAGFAVGIATSSARTWQNLCVCDHARDFCHAIARGSWVTDDLCAELGKRDFATFNATQSQLGGVDIRTALSGSDWDYLQQLGIRKNPGAQKAWMIRKVMAASFPKDTLAVLFDNDASWVQSAQDMNQHDFKTFCVNPTGEPIHGTTDTCSTSAIDYASFDYDGITAALAKATGS